MAYKVAVDAQFAKALGLTLRTLRRIRGHKVIVVHKATGFSETSVSSWETGKNMPSLQNLRALAAFYKVSLSTIIANTEKAMAIMESDKKNDDRDE
jgi:transcriptional regulator with XRE-family HTH domain